MSSKKHPALDTKYGYKEQKGFDENDVLKRFTNYYKEKGSLDGMITNSLEYNSYTKSQELVIKYNPCPDELNSGCILSIYAKNVVVLGNVQPKESKHKPAIKLSAFTSEGLEKFNRDPETKYLTDLKEGETLKESDYTTGYRIRSMLENYLTCLIEEKKELGEWVYDDQFDHLKTKEAKVKLAEAKSRCKHSFLSKKIYTGLSEEFKHVKFKLLHDSVGLISAPEEEDFTKNEYGNKPKNTIITKKILKANGKIDKVYTAIPLRVTKDDVNSILPGGTVYRIIYSLPNLGFYKVGMSLNIKVEYVRIDEEVIKSNKRNIDSSDDEEVQTGIHFNDSE